MASTPSTTTAASIRRQRFSYVEQLSNKRHNDKVILSQRDAEQSRMAQREKIYFYCMCESSCVYLPRVCVSLLFRIACSTIEQNPIAALLFIICFLGILLDFLFVVLMTVHIFSLRTFFYCFLHYVYLNMFCVGDMFKPFHFVFLHWKCARRVS